MSGATKVLLSHPMRKLLWTVAQHRYGWAHVSRFRGQLQVADGLVRRGLVSWVEGSGRDHPLAKVAATPEGFTEIQRRWPVSPFALGTYDHQPNGWDPPEGRSENQEARA